MQAAPPRARGLWSSATADLTYSFHFRKIRAGPLLADAMDGRLDVTLGLGPASFATLASRRRFPVPRSLFAVVASDRVGFVSANAALQSRRSSVENCPSRTCWSRRWTFRTRLGFAFGVCRLLWASILTSKIANIMLQALPLYLRHPSSIALSGLSGCGRPQALDCAGADRASNECFRAASHSCHVPTPQRPFARPRCDRKRQIIDRMARREVDNGNWPDRSAFAHHAPPETKIARRGDMKPGAALYGLVERPGGPYETSPSLRGAEWRRGRAAERSPQNALRMSTTPT